MRIYIAGALSSKENTDRSPSQVIVDYISNVHKMCIAATEVRLLGHAPYVPGLDFVLGLVEGRWEEFDYRGLGMEFLKVCDAVVVISDSWGVQEEIKVAKRLGIPVLYGLKQVPDIGPRR